MKKGDVIEFMIEFISIKDLANSVVEEGVSSALDMIGTEREFYSRENLNGEIIVPFCPEIKLSGVEHKAFMNCVCYKRKFNIPKQHADKKLLHFGAVNYHMLGFCYAQLYDVEQELNGLMTYNREFKFDSDIIKEINSRKAAIKK